MGIRAAPPAQGCGSFRAIRSQPARDRLAAVTACPFVCRRQERRKQKSIQKSIRALLYELGNRESCTPDVAKKEVQVGPQLAVGDPPARILDPLSRWLSDISVLNFRRNPMSLPRLKTRIHLVQRILQKNSPSVQRNLHARVQANRTGLCPRERLARCQPQLSSAGRRSSSQCLTATLSLEVHQMGFWTSNWTPPATRAAVSHFSGPLVQPIM